MAKGASAKPGVLLDTNVLLYMTNPRSPHISAIMRVVGAKDAGRAACFIAAHSLKDFFYISRKAPYSLSQEAAKLWIRHFVDNYGIVDLTRAISKRAALGPGDDYEDNVIAESAKRAGCRYLLTYDGERTSFDDESFIALTAEELSDELGYVDYHVIRVKD